MFEKLCNLTLAVAIACVGSALLLPKSALAFSDLAVKMVATPDAVSLGQSVTFTISVTNLGPDQASYITLSDNLPKGVRLQSASSTNGTCATVSGIPFCNLEGLAAGASATATITVIVEEEQNGDALFNTVFVTASKNKGEPKQNNQAETITPIQDAQK